MPHRDARPSHQACTRDAPLDNIDVSLPASCVERASEITSVAEVLASMEVCREYPMELGCAVSYRAFVEIRNDAMAARCATEVSVACCGFLLTD